MEMFAATKAEILERLAPILKTARILPQVRLTFGEHCQNKRSILSKIERLGWSDRAVIVRSSASSEDGVNQSLAGQFSSFLDVRGTEQILQAIERVFLSFGAASNSDQVFIQPFLKQVAMSGVAFSKHPTSGAPYLMINYDDQSGLTNSVTSGTTNELKAYCHFRDAPFPPPAPLDRIALLMKELEELLGCDQLDIEFAFLQSGELYLLQVRPLAASPSEESSLEDSHKHALALIYRKIQNSYGPHPYLRGSRAIYGIMPDWNPAEIIGVRPKPLALSLYKEIITDQIWAYQRDNYGYCNLRSFPLLIDFHGLPYIDVRVSFNSFIPRSVEEALAEKLVDYYLNRLEEFPNFHDKVEFEIIYSCYTLDLPFRIERLNNYRFSSSEISALSSHLRDLTNTIINEERGLWRTDAEKISSLEKRFQTIRASALDPISKIYWILEDCKRYGTLPFAGLARAAFIAVQLIKSLVNVGILNLEEYHHFLQSLDTVSSRMSRDFSLLDREAFLERYGHLRPGTYDILSPRYDEAPDQYFSWEHKTVSPPSYRPFQLSLEQLKRIETLLKQHGLNHNVISFFDFIKAAIEGREYSKFVFSRSLSYALSLFKEVGKECGLGLEECSFANIQCIQELYGSSADVSRVLETSIQAGKEAYRMAQQILLPPLITNPKQVFSFSLPNTEPNYVTLKRIKARTAKVNDDKHRLRGAILFIPSADPGYDWIFSHGIAAFVTMYGGMNSHMAIRAAELNIPAVIGSGESLYQHWEKAKMLEIDCANRLVRIIQ